MASTKYINTILVVGSFLGLTLATTFPTYGQCGGDGFTSTGSCASGSYCQSENAYYCPSGKTLR